MLILKRISDCKCIFMSMHYGKPYLNYRVIYVIRFNYTSYNVLHKIITRLHKYFTQRQSANKQDGRSNLYFAKLLSSVWGLNNIAINTIDDHLIINRISFVKHIYFLWNHYISIWKYKQYILFKWLAVQLYRMSQVG